MNLKNKLTLIFFALVFGGIAVDAFLLLRGLH